MSTTTTAVRPASKPLSKADEIALLDQVIAQFGGDSYIGATLMDQRESIVQDIKSDIAPIQLDYLRRCETELQIKIRESEKAALALYERCKSLTEQEQAMHRKILALDNDRRVNVEALRIAAQDAITALRQIAK